MIFIVTKVHIIVLYSYFLLSHLYILSIFFWFPQLRPMSNVLHHKLGISHGCYRKKHATFLAISEPGDGAKYEVILPLLSNSAATKAETSGH